MLGSFLIFIGTSVYRTLSPSLLALSSNNLSNISFNISSASILNGWFRDYLWFNLSSLIRGYDLFGSNDLGIWAWTFLLAHLCWAVSFMFLISWCGYWQELIDSVISSPQGTFPIYILDPFLFLPDRTIYCAGTIYRLKSSFRRLYPNVRSLFNHLFGVIKVWQIL